MIHKEYQNRTILDTFDYSSQRRITMHHLILNRLTIDIKYIDVIPGAVVAGEKSKPPSSSGNASTPSKESTTTA